MAKANHDEEGNETTSGGSKEAAEAPTKQQLLQIDNTSAVSLIQKMVSLGYFHEQKNDNDYDDDGGNNDITPLEHEETTSGKRAERDDVTHSHTDNYTIESIKQEKSKLSSTRMNYKCDQGCILLFPTGGSYNNPNGDKNGEIFCMTREYLKKELNSILLRQKRISLDMICDQMKVTLLDVQRAAKEIVNVENTKYNSGANDDSIISCNGGQIHFIEKQNELVTDAYLNEIFESKVLSQLDATGAICISDLSMNLFHLPVDFIAGAIQRRLGDQIGASRCIAGGWTFRPDVKMATIDGVKKIITSKYENMKNEEVREMLINAVEPVKVSQWYLCASHSTHF